MLSSRTRKRNKKQDAAVKGNSLSSTSSSNENGFSAVAGRKEKRQKTSKHHPKQRLSILERLPVEILQMIFDVWPTPSLPRSSPILGRSLSSRPSLMKTCFNLWKLSEDIHDSLRDSDDDQSPSRQSRYPSDALQKVKLKNELLDCPWFDLNFTLRLELMLLHGSDNYTQFDPEEAIEPLEPAYFAHQEYMPTARSTFSWNDCFIPPKLLRGPWKTDDLSLFILQCPRLNLSIDLTNSVTQEAAIQGVWNCIRQKNWLILFHLFELPYYFSGMDEDPRLTQDLRFTLTDLIRQADPLADEHRCPEDPAKTNILHVTQEMLHSAIIDHGCDRGIVSLLLIQGLYDTKQVNYLDPLLWDWAENHMHHEVGDSGSPTGVGWTDGKWLKMMLRAVNKFAEHISLPMVPQGASHSMSDLVDSSYRTFQQRQGLVLLECFRDDVDVFRYDEGNAGAIGWYWQEIKIDGKESSRSKQSAMDDTSRLRATFEAERMKAGGRIDLWGVRPGTTPWINSVFNEEILRDWFGKPYTGQIYYQTEQLDVAVLKLSELLSHIYACDKHQRSIPT